MWTNKGRVKTVGILTAGGDCPGLNAVLRAITKSLVPEGVEILGFLEGFRGLVDNRYMKLDDAMTSGLLTVGGTILRTSRDKPHKMPTNAGTTEDKTSQAVETYHRLGLDCLICLGGGGTQKNAYNLAQQGGLNIITVPKTIDNDVYGTDTSFGFDTAMYIATEAIDRLHTTASSHHRVMVVDIMGHNTGWLALGAGVAGGADVILIPEIPYSLQIVAESLLARMARGKMFSIVAVAEGAVIRDGETLPKNGSIKKDRRKSRHTKEPISAILAEYLEEATGLETRITSLGHLQRGGVPTPADRLLCTEFGMQAATQVLKGEFGVMIAKRGQDYVPVDLSEVVKQRREVTADHPWIVAARAVGTCLGDVIPHGYTARPASLLNSGGAK